MEEQVLGITKIVNWLLAKPTLAMLSLLHIQPANPEYPIPNHVAMEILVLVIAAALFLWLKSRISVERPGGLQQCMEALITNSMGVGIGDLLEENGGHGGRRYVAMLGSIGLFVLFCNLIGLVPGLASPTAESSVPLGCAIVVFLYYNWSGLVHHGPLGYGKLFMGPVLPLAPIMLPIEIVSHFARLLSLTVRLWVNMLVSELLYVLFLGLTFGLFVSVRDLSSLGYLLLPVPLLVPIVFILLHIFVGFLQAFVFTLLPAIYIGGAVAEEH